MPSTTDQGRQLARDPGAKSAEIQPARGVAEGQVWTRVITPATGLAIVPAKALWEYRDLIWLLAKRDITATYKQTLLGPLWYLLQPLLTTGTFSFVFGRLADLGTEHVPHFVFYMSGLVIWSYFADCVNKSSLTFTKNAQLFGKVYFPRLVAPLANLLSNLLPFLVQFFVVSGAIIYYLYTDPRSHLNPSWRIALLPLLVAQTAILALGIGCTVSAMTTRYKDLTMGIGFGLNLWMYASSIVVPLSTIRPQYRWILNVNPMTPIVEGFRLCLIGHGTVNARHLVYSAAVSILALLLGLVLFNRAERTVIDTV